MLRSVEFAESRKMYSFFIAVFVVVNVGIHAFGYFIEATLSARLAVTLLMICEILLFTKFQYQWPLPRYFYIFLLIGLGLATVGFVQASDPSVVFIFLLFALGPLIFITGGLGSYVFSIQAQYNSETHLLSVTYNKLYCTITEIYTLASEHLQLHSVQNPGFFKKTMFHFIEDAQGQKIAIAPLNVNGFTLPNKLIELLQPRTLSIDQITRTNAAAILPRAQKWSLDVPQDRSSIGLSASRSSR